jgi:hypothetical protein
MEDCDTWLSKKPAQIKPAPAKEEFDRWFSGTESIAPVEEIQRSAQLFKLLGSPQSDAKKSL